VRSRIIVAVEKQFVLHICVGVRALACACMRVPGRHIVTSIVALLDPPYFSTLSHKRRDFWKKKKKVIEDKMCVLICSTTFV
jgi:hypothetical protein